MLSGETPTKSPVLLRATRGKSPPAARVERSAHIYMLQSNTTAANRDSGSSRQIAMRVADEGVDLTTLWMGNRNDCLSSECFINLLNKARSRTPRLPPQVSKELTNSYVFNINWLIEQGANLSRVVVPVCCRIMLPIEICYLVVLRMRDTSSKDSAVYLCFEQW